MKELSETKLPEELLQSLDSEIPKKRKKTSNSKVKQKEAKKEIENGKNEAKDCLGLESISV